MSVGLKLSGQIWLIKHQIVSVEDRGNEIHINMSDGFQYRVLTKDNTRYESSMINYQGASIISIDVNEYHRVYRELFNYLGA